MNYQPVKNSVDFSPNEPNVAYIGEGCNFKGVLQVPDSIVIDGVVEGDLTARSIKVGSSGAIKGNIIATEADIQGTVTENLEVKQLLIVRLTGRIEGTVSYGELQLEKGAVITGSFSSTDFRSEKKPYKEPYKENVSSKTDRLRLPYEPVIAAMPASEI
ncbi:MAG: polymer-forming cytoskeletal protein [Bradyrhizobiaceae bacterium]|nr:MAG: polymer-forming cytoskeletal protein [Bradyrhizobiaceae bacterium]